MKKIHVGLLGYGNVGQGVAKIILENGNLIAQRLGAEFILKSIAVRDLSAPREISVDKGLLTTDPSSIVNDPDVDIVVELIGGCNAAHDLTMAAIKNGKHVVTANKALLALHSKDIFQASTEKGVDIGFEASVGGGIPIIRSMREGFSANRFNSVFGILNGTCNYILSRMSDEGGCFEDILKDAQEKGYAEADPSFDIDGVDSAHKIAILASIAYGGYLNFDDIYVEGIRNITAEDIEYAKELGYRIKLLALAKETNGEVEVRVHPTMVTDSNPISGVNGVLNAIGIIGDMVDESLLVGMGAGGKQTASAVVSDMIEIGRNIIAGGVCRVKPLSYLNNTLTELKIKKIEDVESAYYMRFLVQDNPGVLSSISGVLGTHSIGIESVIQKGRSKSEGVPLVIMTHTANEANVRNAVEELNELDFVFSKTILIRVEKEV